MASEHNSPADYSLEKQAEDINAVGSFLAQRDVPELITKTAQADFIILAGSALPCTAEIAAEAIHNGVAKELLITGGTGHSTAPLYAAVKRVPKLAHLEVAGQTEAEVLRRIVTEVCHVPNEKVMLETKSLNCSENASKSIELLATQGRDHVKAILIQDPTMQRRTMASFHKHLEHREDIQMQVISFAPFIPVVEVQSDSKGFQFSDQMEALQPIWSVEHYTALIMGDMLRLHDTEQGYGPRACYVRLP
ncbi:hypothetical protein KFL_005390050 [Klebsormidium nitens]|uniref:DUF218 domain-containing protein n=1 Tax=Klebsormidium nitens TaxID=105231 RepID=A0A1Y1IFC1_KLENI|nr:hypothetical protein KFL_005390050 [Klebsormidium nitens]|eukprot:GAQ89585.1 hypothetical protein KFL_005390050 [Klebsormidium nitens]